MAIGTPTGFNTLPLPLAQLCLAAVLKCGQSFRWSIFPLHPPFPETSPTHEYRLCLRDRVVCLRQSSDTLFYRSVFPVPPRLEELPRRDAETLSWIRDYFQLNIDLVSLYDKWSDKDPVFKALRHRFAGIRILRQDPWENLISFICSSNNNISRITSMVQALCTHYSQPLLYLPSPTSEATSLPSPRPESESGETETKEPAHAYHPFPSPLALADVDVSATLCALKFGYRADFIQKTAQMLVEEHGSTEAEAWLATLRKTETSDARVELLKFMGVGRKVADCVLLMSLDKAEVIPVDTHVHQIAVKQYGFRGAGKGNMTPKLYNELSLKLAAVWGEYAGWAHTVLFTADLKSFSEYGLLPPTPAATPSIELAELSLKGALHTPSPSPTKRKRSFKRSEVEDRVETSVDVPKETLIESQSSAFLSLAERVKKRSRRSTTT